MNRQVKGVIRQEVLFVHESLALTPQQKHPRQGPSQQSIQEYMRGTTSQIKSKRTRIERMRDKCRCETDRVTG